jgi:hypothetical protein
MRWIPLLKRRLPPLLLLLHSRKVATISLLPPLPQVPLSCQKLF